MFVDADDIIDPFYIETLLEQSNGVDLICSSFRLQKGNQDTQYRNHGILQSQTFTSKMLLSYLEDYYCKPYQYTLLVHCWNKLFRRDLLLAGNLVIDTTKSQLEDIQFVSSYLIAANRVRYVDYPGYLQVQIGQNNNLSAVSGEGGIAASDSMVSALQPINKVKQRLLDEFGIEERFSFAHLITSVMVLFSLRMARRFWQLYSLKTIASIYLWVLPIKDKGYLSKFRRVSGESALLWFSLKFLPAFLSVLVLVLVGRKR